jgi:hypothetical protein
MEISAIQSEFVQWWDISLDLILLMEVCNFPLLWTGTEFRGDAIDLQTYGLHEVHVAALTLDFNMS